MQIVAIAVATLDGRITRPGEAGAGFASSADQTWFRRSLQGFDCAVMGRRTYSSVRDQLLERVRSTSDGAARIVMTRRPMTHAGDAVPGLLEFTNSPPAAIVRDLRARGFSRCAVLGGGEVYRQFLAARLVDALWLTLEPIAFGAGTPLVDGVIPELGFELHEMRHLSADTLLLNYTPKGAASGVPLPPA